MNHLSETEFLEWAASKDLDPGERFPEIVWMQFLGGTARTFSWGTPGKPERRPHFFATLLAAMGDWERCYGWRHSGSWPGIEESDWDGASGLVERAILGGIGMPLGTADVVRFDRSDWAALLTVALSASIFSWSVQGDLIVVPDNACCFLRVSHHDCVDVTFRNADEGDALSHEMDRWGFGPGQILEGLG